MRVDKLFIKNKNDNDYFFMKKIEIKKSGLHGWGVFATEVIKKDELFEACPVILFHKSLIKDWCIANDRPSHILNDFCFSWGRDGLAAAVLGWGMMYNHSEEPNAKAFSRYEKERPRMLIMAKTQIEPGEEICLRYQKSKRGLCWSGAGTRHRI